MGYKIAVASSDGVFSDLEFGMADQFYIYDVDDEKNITFSEIRKYVQEKAGELQEPGNRCGKGAEKKVELIEDCRCIICSHIGPKMSKNFTVRGISVFDIEGGIDPIINRIADYYKKK